MGITAHLHTVRVCHLVDRLLVWCGVVWYINTEIDCRVCMK